MDNKKKGIGIFIAAIMVISVFAVSVSPIAALKWHGGKALVLYTDDQGGWVQYNYTGSGWANFRTNFAQEGWTADYARHVNAAMLQDYDVLFVLTPKKDIPDDEAAAIIDWVKDGGQLLITQNEWMTHANKITGVFGINYITGVQWFWNMTEFDRTDKLTTTPRWLTEVKGFTVQPITTVSPARCVGWNNASKTYCYLAVNDQAGSGIVIAVGEGHMWHNIYFPQADNEELMDNVLKRCWDHSYPAPVPTLTPIGLIALVGLLSIVAAMSISIKKKRR